MNNLTKKEVAVAGAYLLLAAPLGAMLLPMHEYMHCLGHWLNDPDAPCRATYHAAPWATEGFEGGRATAHGGEWEHPIIYTVQAAFVVAYAGSAIPVLDYFSSSTCGDVDDNAARKREGRVPPLVEECEVDAVHFQVVLDDIRSAIS